MTPSGYIFLIMIAYLAIIICCIFAPDLRNGWRYIFLNERRMRQTYAEFHDRATKICHEASMRGRNEAEINWYNRIPTETRAIELMRQYKDWTKVFVGYYGNKILMEMKSDGFKMGENYTKQEKSV